MSDRDRKSGPQYDEGGSARESDGLDPMLIVFQSILMNAHTTYQIV